MIAQTLLNLLACPKTGEALKAQDDTLVSESAGSYPLIANIPWLLPNPQNSIHDWIAKLHYFHQILNQEIQELKDATTQLSGPTQKRLQILLDGKQHFLRDVTQLLTPLVHHPAGRIEVYQALHDRAPNTQNLLSYEANLYRDWVWGEDENQLTVDIVSNQIGAANIDKFLVLGAGAGRLALDIHKNMQPNISIAADINPLLVFAANHLMSNHDLPIYEFPLHPRLSEYAAIEHHIKGFHKPENFHWVFSDANKPSFLQHSFDLVLTPWLIDIQPFELSQFLQQLNQYLPIGGKWVNFGSLVFNQQRDSFCYSIEEVQAIATQQGFTIQNIQEHEIPYLQSPYNAGYRVERVWSWHAFKEKDVKSLSNQQTLPDWLLQTNKAVPKAAYFQQLSLSHRIYAQLTAEVDGKTSLNKMAKKLAKQNQLDEEECLRMVTRFFMDIYFQNN